MNTPNILLLLIDEMRGDCMGWTGHPDVKTPYIDTLAAQGVAFRNAYTSCPSCIAARAVLHTGRSPRETGRVGYADGVPWNYRTTLAGELASAGYLTENVGKMHVHPLRSLLGFHHVTLHDGYLHYYRRPDIPYCESQFVADDYYHWLHDQLGADADPNENGIECNGFTARPWHLEDKYHPTNWVATQTIDFLRSRDQRKPFFLCASFVRPHAPYDAPQAFFDLYRNRSIQPPAKGDWDDPAIRKFGRVYNGPATPADPELEREMQIGYYACITHLDHQIGRIYQALVDHQLMQNTVILLVSDHGELLGDHGLQHKSMPYQGCAHIPMILSGPEKWIGECGRIDDSLVELRDIMPTCLELAGASIPGTCEGASLLHSPQRAWLHGEHTNGMFSNHWIVTKTDKYIWFSQSGKEQYFCLEEDPNETHDRIDSPECQNRIAELRCLLIRDLEGREEGFTDGTHLFPGRPVSSVLACATRED